MAEKVFGTKAETLKALFNGTTLNIVPIFIITFGEWKENQSNILFSLQNFIDDDVAAYCKNHMTVRRDLYAVRSSSTLEDTDETSSAGAFCSLLNIKISSSSYRELKNAVDTVFASYPKCSKNEQVLVQPMIESVLSGVLTTRVLADGSPYYVINYDDESGKTDTVTSGIGVNKTVYIYRNAKKSDFDSRRLFQIYSFAKEVENICNSDSLDIEFCIDGKENIFLLQVRPLCTQKQWIENSDDNVRSNINFIIDFLQRRMKGQIGLLGKTTILGCMPDWNPAEMIGVTPRPLATSLYRHFITKRIWSKARELMGYRQMPPEELMVLLAGRPYIDVRLSFNSFLPQGIDHITGEALVDAWVDRLDCNPFLHDKIEFEIAQTAMNFTFEEDFENRYGGLLSKERKAQYRSQLALLTLKCMDLSVPHRNLYSCNNSMAWAFEAIGELKNRQSAGRRFGGFHGLDKDNVLPIIVLLAEECMNFGTLAFSVLARHAFIAESLLRSAVIKGALSQDRYGELKQSIKTISGIMSDDFQKVQQEKISKNSFMETYGHLRPSTYDILSCRYSDRKELFEGSVSHAVHENEKAFVFSSKEKHNIETLLAEADLPHSVSMFHAYVSKAVAGREMAKFIFTKNISDILELIAYFGSQYGLDRETMSYIDFRDIIEWSSRALLQNPKEYFEELAQIGKKNFEVSKSLKLGYLIRSPRDVFVVPQHRNAPNFIGKGRVEAQVSVLSALSSCSEKIDGSIVCIESADPGFDWIFTRNIAGLVTKFGGTNSHMAIRCAEYGLPAAIGVGEVIFNLATKAQHCILNIDSNEIIPL